MMMSKNQKIENKFYFYFMRSVVGFVTRNENRVRVLSKTYLKKKNKEGNKFFERLMYFDICTEKCLRQLDKPSKKRGLEINSLENIFTFFYIDFYLSVTNKFQMLPLKIYFYICF